MSGCSSSLVAPQKPPFAAANDKSAAGMARKVSDATAKALASVDADIWRWSHDKLILLLEEIYWELGLVESLGMDANTLHNFLVSLLF